MKTAFNILPERNESDGLHLLVEVGCYGISFLWFAKDPFDIRGIAVYNFINKNSPEEIAAEVESILQSNSVFTGSYVSSTICYDFKESLLVPEAYYNPATADSMLNLLYATDHSSSFITEPVKGNTIFNVYAVDKKVESVLKRYFPAAGFHHSSSLQLETQQTDADKNMCCIFFHNSVKVFMFKGQALQIVQQFNYNTPVDAAYHLLNCCEQYGASPSEIRLLLSGMVDEKSKLYDELYRYFLNIEFEKPANTQFHDRIKFYPSHFFSHLTGLASCVS